MPTDSETAPVLLDTGAVIAHMVGHAEISQRIRAAERCFLPLTALGELRHGVHKSQRQRQGSTKEAAKVERVLRIVEILYPGDQTADEYGRMIDALEARGQRIPTNDIWIAATAVQYGLPLLATDAHFKRIDNLKLSLFAP
ncbi:MAG: PIN domain-containing protein [Opitutales bacterium]